MSPLGYYKRKKRDKPMRARTYIYIVGMAALTLQGCCKKSHPNTPDVERHAIGMAAQSVTRALIEDIGNLSEFAVYGYKQGPVSQMVFSNQLVTRNGNAWTYTPTKYWDRTAIFSFAAYAPIDVTKTHDDETRTLTLSLPQWQTVDAATKDIVVATSQGPANNYLNLHGGQVNLDFNHLYAQLEVQVWVADFIESTYLIKTLACKDANAPEDKTGDNITQASYTLDYDATPVAASYTVTAAADSAILYTDATGLQANKKEPSATTTEATFKHMVVPFTSADPTNGFDLTIGYTISGEAYYTTVHSTIKEMKAGQRYVLTLTFSSGNMITPDVTLQEWVPVDVEEDDKFNW